MEDVLQISELEPTAVYTFAAKYRLSPEFRERVNIRPTEAIRQNVGMEIHSKFDIPNNSQFLTSEQISKIIKITNRDEILVNDILLSKDIVAATDYVLEINSHNNETGDGF